MATQHPEKHIPRLSRRDALRLGAGASAAAILAACGGSSPTITPAATATAPPKAPANASPTTGGAPTSGSAAAPSGATSITIPKTGAQLPTEKVSFHWVDSGGVKATFFKQYFPAYQRVHPNITVSYDALPWTEIAKVVPLGVQNGNAPDVFQIPQGFTPGQAVQQNWARPLDDVIPNFAQWKAAWPSGTFFEGINVFNGKTYTFPFWSNKGYDTLLLYNVDYMKQAGMSPQDKPLTWDEYRTAAKKITAAGKGKYYGVIIGGAQTNRWEAIVRNLASMAGASGGGGTARTSDINWKTGEYNYTTPQYLAAIDLLLGLKSDGSVFPGSLSINALQARAQIAQGVAGMILQGVYCIPQWIQENPAFNFDVASQPVPNTGAPLPVTYGAGGGENFWLFTKSKYPTVAGDIFSYIGSIEGQTAVITISGGSRQSVFAKANEAAHVEARARKAATLFDQQTRLGPSPSIRNPETAQVDLELKTVTPDFGTTVQGIFSGQVSDAKKAMQDLKDRMEKELERAIKAAQAKGAKVSRNDYVFPNWDPTKDYTQADYAALKK